MQSMTLSRIMQDIINSKLSVDGRCEALVKGMLNASWAERHETSKIKFKRFDTLEIGQHLKKDGPPRRLK